MNLWQKLGLAVGLACTGKQAAATVATIAAAGVTAAQLGVDPIPWAIGAAGSTVVYAYRKPATRQHALANFVVCVFLGGLVAPWVGTLIAQKYGAVWSNDYVLAGVMSVAWPWAAPVLWRRAVATFNALTAPERKGGQP